MPCQRAAKDISLILETQSCTIKAEIPPRKPEIPISTKLGRGVGWSVGCKYWSSKLSENIFTQQAFSYNLAGDMSSREAWVSSSKQPKPGNEHQFLKVMKGCSGIGTGYSRIYLFFQKETCKPEFVENLKLRFSRGYLGFCGTAYCIWSDISLISNLSQWSSSLGLFCHVPLKRDQGY